MYQRLLLINEAIGKTTLDEVYSMTPREADTIIAGGYRHSLNALVDNQFVTSSTLVPTVMVDPDKFSYDDIDKQLKKRQQNIEALTDRKVQKKLDNQKQEQQRFINIFGFNKKRGG